MRWKKLTIFFFVAVLAIPALLMPTKRAEAFFGCTPVITPPVPVGLFVPAYDASTAIQMSTSNLYNSSIYQKQCILDGLVKILAKSLINNLTGSIVDWINKDFQGGPAFITNPAGFFVNIADETAGEFIETQLGPIGQLLCSPFDLRLRINLSLATVASRKQYLGCRLSEIEKNAYSAFTNGGFIANGGWRTFNALTSDPRNNQFGAYIMASDALNTEFIKKANEKLRELSYGRGFLSYKKCTQWSEGPNEGTGEGGEKKCLSYQTLTPGSVIESQLGNALGTDLRQYELADNFNAILGAVVNYGLRQVFSSGGGLLSASSQNAGNPSSVAQQLRNNDFSALYALSNEQGNDTNTGKVSTVVGEISKTEATVTAAKDAKAVNGTVGGEVQTDKNIAKNKAARQSSDYASGLGGGQTFTQAARLAVDTITDGSYSAAETQNEQYPWWEVDLGTEQSIKTMELYTGSQYPVTGCIVLSNTELPDAPVPCTNQTPLIPTPDKRNKVIVSVNGSGRFVRVQHNNTTNLFLYEVKVFPQESGVEASSAATVVPTQTGTPQISARSETKLSATLTVNEVINNVRLKIRLRQHTEQGFTDFAPGLLFTDLSVVVKNADTGNTLFTEPLVIRDRSEKNTILATNDATPYITSNRFSALKKQKVTIEYSFTPFINKDNLYEFVTNLVDSSDTLINDVQSVLTFRINP